MVYHFIKSRVFCNQKVDSPEIVLLRNEVRTAMNGKKNFFHSLRFLP